MIDTQKRVDLTTKVGGEMPIKINYVSPRNIRQLKKPVDSFTFISRKIPWKESRLNFYKEAKAVLLKGNDEAFAWCTIPRDKKSVSIDSSEEVTYDFKSLFKTAKKAKATSVIIAQSYVAELEEVTSEKDQIEFAKDLKQQAKEFNLKVGDIVLMSSNTCSTFKMNGYI